MATLSFAALGKDSSDLQARGFPTKGFTVIADTTTPNGIGFKTTGKCIDGAVSLTVAPSFKWTEHNATFGGTTVSDKSYSGTVSFADAFTKGVNLNLGVAVASTGDLPLSATTGVSYVNEFVNVTGTGTFKQTGWSTPNIDVSAVVQYPPNIYWGGNVIYDTSKGTEAKPVVNARAQIVATDYTMSLALKDNQTSHDLSFSWFQKISDTVKYASSFVINSKPTSTPTCTVASEYKVDSVTTVRGKLSVSEPTKFRLGLGLTQVLSAHTVASVGADINASGLLGIPGGSDNSVGFEVQLK